MSAVPVLIVGAGPTGLNLANLLADYGIDFRLIEQKSEPTQTSNALAVQIRSLEMWDSMGIADQAIAAGKKIHGLALHNKTKQLGKISFEHAQLKTKFPFLLGLSQSETESLLTNYLSSEKVERNITLTTLSQTEKNIIATLQHADGSTETVTCDWLIAADGSHSLVRKNLNLAFNGAMIPEKFIMTDITVNADFDPNYVQAFLSPTGPLVFMPMKDFTRIICTVTHDINTIFENPTITDFQEAIATRCSTPVKISNPLWISHFVAHHRILENYHHGRILFAGDSAHIHSPIGGQGMNTGMQDTFNLAWKLALVIKGKSKFNLLNTYQDERYPIAKAVLKNTTRMTFMVTLKNPCFIYLRNLFLKLILKLNFVQQRLVQNLSEITITYPKSNIIHQVGNTKIKAGQRVLDFSLLDSVGKKILLSDLLKGLKHKLVIFVDESSNATDIERTITQVKTTHNDFIEIIVICSPATHLKNRSAYLDMALVAHHTYGLEQGGMMLVRPDLYVGLMSNRINGDLIANYFLAFS